MLSAPLKTGLLQRKCDCGQHTIAGSECEGCGNQRVRGSLQRAALSHVAISTVPPVVNEVLCSAGRPLDATTRTVMEAHFSRKLQDTPPQHAGVSQDSLSRLTIGPTNDPLEQEAQRAAGQIGQTTEASNSSGQFGYDFSQVRVHTDSKAAESARAVNALAYTVGRDIVFGAGQYSPQSAPGQRLLAHELSHVVQQRSVVSAPSLQRAPLDYDPTAFKLTPPTQPFTLVDAKNRVEQKKNAKPPELTSGAVKGALPGSDEEIFLWFIAAKVGRRDRWGTELDMLTDIGWPATPTDSAPVGKVTVTIDTAGNAAAELISKGTVTAPTTFTKVEDAKKALQGGKYQIADVVDGDVKWSPADINKVAGAFALLPDGDRLALKGVVLQRVSTIDGKAAGRFSSSQSAAGTTAINTATLELADSAFSSDTESFVGGKKKASPSSYLTIVHEVGHAVATKAKRDADVAQTEAVAKSNKLVAPLNVAVAEFNTANAATNALIDEFNVLVGTFNDSLKTKDAKQIAAAKKALDAKKKELDASKSELDKLRKVEVAKRKALDTAKKDVEDKKKLAEAMHIDDATIAPIKATADAAKAGPVAALKAAQNTAAAFQPKETTDSASYRKSVEDAQKAIEDYETSAAAVDADLGALEKTAQTALDARNKERDDLKKTSATNPALAAFAPVETAQDARFKAAIGYALAKERPKRVQKFVEFVDKKKITPFTKYAQDNWPHKPGEFYAEAYSLWRTDPDYLKANAKDLFNWFETAEYLK